MTENGTVASWNTAKRTGYINRDSGGTAFVNYTAIQGEPRSLIVGQRVSFIFSKNTAQDVRKI